MIVLSPSEWEAWRRRYGDDPETWLAKFMAEWYEVAKTLRISPQETE